MKTANLQSIKARNADTITELHARVRIARLQAKFHFQAAQKELKHARKVAATIKKLAAEQIALKQSIKGPPKAKKPARPDTRALVVSADGLHTNLEIPAAHQVIRTPFGDRLAAN